MSRPIATTIRLGQDKRHPRPARTNYLSELAACAGCVANFFVRISAVRDANASPGLSVNRSGYQAVGATCAAVVPAFGARDATSRYRPTRPVRRGSGRTRR
jgi:hypothetical protein